jgi:translation initiation factor IF-2
MEGFVGDENKLAEGVVVESYLDPKRGPTATLLVRDGSFGQGDIIGTASAFGKIKTLENFKSETVEKAMPSFPVVATGFNEVPEVGEKFYKRNSMEEAEAYFEKKERKKTGDGEVLNIIPGKKVLNLIVKADVQGSLQAIQEILKIIPQEEVVLRILKAEVGEISESDVKLAMASNSSIVGFRVKIVSNAASLAERSDVRVLSFDIIYEMTQGVRSLMEAMIKPEILRKEVGRLEVKEIFRTEKNRQIVGGRVVFGEVRRGVQIEVTRQGEKIGNGKLVQLQQNKKEIGKVSQGQDCGMLFEGDVKIQPEDVLEFFEEERKKRGL